MANTLLSCVKRYSEHYADQQGIARSPISGLSNIRATRASELEYMVCRPLVAIVLQGVKRVTVGHETFDFGAGESLLITADVPTVSQITRANIAEPYLSFVLELDIGIIEELSSEIDAVAQPHGASVRVNPTEGEVEDAALRLMQLLERPSAMPILKQQLLREIHYWLMVGRHGAAIRSLGIADSYAQRISKAVALIRKNYSNSIRVEDLADTAGMSPSAFHQHFKAITSLSPLQFQKQMRLIEARRMMVSEGLSCTNAAYSVGYESVSQFNREYARMFGMPPVRDLRVTRQKMAEAA